MKVPLNVDLIAIIEQAIPQIFGSDERELLQAFLDRVSAGEDEPQVPIKLDLSKCLIKTDEPGG